MTPVLPADSRNVDSAAAAPQRFAVVTPRWHRPALIAFACINAASVGTFFVVFIGLIAFPPEPRSALFLLEVGSFALAVLVMGQFVYWSRLALRALRERR